MNIYENDYVFGNVIIEFYVSIMLSIVQYLWFAESVKHNKLNNILQIPMHYIQIADENDTMIQKCHQQMSEN